MVTGGWSQAPTSLLLSLPGSRMGSSSLLESRLNTSHSPTGGSAPGTSAFPPEQRTGLPHTVLPCHLLWTFYTSALHSQHWLSPGPPWHQLSGTSPPFLFPLTLVTLPEAESSLSEAPRVSKLISVHLSVSFSSGIVLMSSGPSLFWPQGAVWGPCSSQSLDATFLVLRFLPLIGVLPGAATVPIAKLGLFLARPRPRPRPEEAVPRLLGSSTSGISAETGSSKSLSSLKFTWDQRKAEGPLEMASSDSRWRCRAMKGTIIREDKNFPLHQLLLIYFV